MMLLFLRFMCCHLFINYAPRNRKPDNFSLKRVEQIQAREKLFSRFFFL